jgi:hypothetical protein
MTVSLVIVVNMSFSFCMIEQFMLKLCLLRHWLLHVSLSFLLTLSMIVSIGYFTDA